MEHISDVRLYKVNKMKKYIWAFLITILMLNLPISAVTLMDTNPLDNEESSSTVNWDVSFIYEELSISSLPSTISVDGTMWSIVESENNSNQKSVVRIPEPIPTPEPTTILLFGLGLAGVIAIKKRL